MDPKKLAEKLKREIIEYVDRLDVLEMAGKGHEWTLNGTTICKLDFTGLPTSGQTELTN
jgi:hypothetical protein